MELSVINGIMYICMILIIVYIINFDFINNHLGGGYEHIKLMFSYIIRTILN
jgi:hypothetical protein